MLFLCKNKAAVRACAQITGKEHTMKKLETVLAVTAAMILALSAAGCSSSSDDDDNETGGAGELVSKELEISETPQLLVKADELKNISSLTISITNIYTSESNWWFGIVDENGENYQEIKWKSGESSECIYELSITDFSTYSNGIYIKGVSSTATVKVTAEEGSASQDTPSNTETPSDTDTSSGNGNSGTENGDEEDNSKINNNKTIEIPISTTQDDWKTANLTASAGITFTINLTGISTLDNNYVYFWADNGDANNYPVVPTVNTKEDGKSLTATVILPETSTGKSHIKVTYQDSEWNDISGINIYIEVN